MKRAILVVIVVIMCSKMFIPNIKPDLSSDTKIYYKQFIEKIQGEYTKNKLNYIKNEKRKIEKAKKQLRDEEIEPEAFEIIQKRTKSEKALRNVVKYSEYLKNKDNGKFVYGFYKSDIYSEEEILICDEIPNEFIKAQNSIGYFNGIHMKKENGKWFFNPKDLVALKII